MIRDVADKTACRMPKHVYLSPDVNACVFFNTSFWSIFFPVRKNMEIGIGLFEGTSVEEVKSIIAHEFGHFSQNSMKVGSTVYITNTILHNLVYAKDSLDKFIDKLCLVDTTFIRIAGMLTRWLINLIKRPTLCVYKFVQKGYLKLSRFMEYDADNISCQCVGTENFISAICKTEILSKKDKLYKSVLGSLVNEKKMVSNYFTARHVFYNNLQYEDMPLLSYDVLMSHSIYKFHIPQRVKVEDVWASHPTNEERIENVKKHNFEIKIKRESIPSWSLIPISLSDRLSKKYISLISINTGEPMSIISDEEFAIWARNEINENFIDKRIQPFFGKNIVEFDLDKATKEPDENPLNDDNAQKIAKFCSYLNDWTVLNQVKNGEIDVKEVLLDNHVYSRKNLPIEKFKEELDILYTEVVEIYSSIYAYISNRCGEEQKSHFRLGFISVFYARHIRNEILPQLLVHRDKLYKELSRAYRRNEDEYTQLCGDVRDYEKHLKKVISSFDLEWMSHTFINAKYIKELEDYIGHDHNPRFSISINDVNEMFLITDRLTNIVDTIEGNALHLICDITTEQFNRNHSANITVAVPS